MVGMSLLLGAGQAGGEPAGAVGVAAVSAVVADAAAAGFGLVGLGRGFEVAGRGGAAVGPHAGPRLHGVVGMAAQGGDLALDVGIPIARSGRQAQISTPMAAMTSSTTRAAR
jgi:hypothetical protein